MIEFVSAVLMIIGGFVALLAGVGLLRFGSSYARFHAAGKASPVAFVVAAAGVALKVGGTGTLLVLTAVGAIVLTLPVGVHLLFRAFYRTSANTTLRVDELSDGPAPGR